ncbi:MAG: pilus assembly protein N-terminal domain-containing protein [Geminicoccaceae bacterium]
MMNGTGTMFGRLEGRLTSSLVLAAALAFGLPADGVAQSWQLEREQGVGGGGKPGKVATQADASTNAGKRVGVSIVIEPADDSIIRAAEGVPVSPFEDEAPPAANTPASSVTAASDSVAADPNAAIAAALAEAAATASRAAAAKPALAPETVAPADVATTATRSTPPTAAELLNGSPPRPIRTTEVAALPAVEQAQFSPNTAAGPKRILPPRSNEQAASPAVLPSPRKPVQPVQPAPTVQQTALTPGVAAASKEAVLRTAPPPDNQLVELVEPPRDYSLAVRAGGAQVLNLKQPVSNVFVADPNVADAAVLSPTQIIVHGVDFGRTTAFGIDDRGEVVFAFDVDTVPDADAAQQKLKAAAPSATTNVSLRSGGLVADGEVAGVGDAIAISNVTDGLQQTQGPTANNTTIEGSQQVNIRVRFAEVSRNDVFSLGVNWDALADTGDFLFGLSTGNFLSAGSDLNPRDIGIDESFGRFDFNGDFGDVSIDAFIDALQREGIVNVLAEPNLTSVNGEPANFLAGGEIPILVPGGGGSETVTIDYKPFGVSLDFIPTLLPGERINLRVRPEVSSISQAGAVVLDGFSVPAFTVRRAETSVELASGQTFAIAGLFQRDLATDTDKFPVLGDVPVLGQLFKSQRFRRYETELVILITPYLVKPTSNRNVVLPNDRLDTTAKPLVRQDKKRAGFIVK